MKISAILYNIGLEFFKMTPPILIYVESLIIIMLLCIQKFGMSYGFNAGKNVRTQIGESPYYFNNYYVEYAVSDLNTQKLMNYVLLGTVYGVQILLSTWLLINYNYNIIKFEELNKIQLYSMITILILYLFPKMLYFIFASSVKFNLFHYNRELIKQKSFIINYFKINDDNESIKMLINLRNKAIQNKKLVYTLYNFDKLLLQFYFLSIVLIICFIYYIYDINKR